MEETKHPLQSKTIWASLFQLVGSALLFAGVIGAEEAAELINTGPDVVVGAIGAGMSLITFFTRFTAKSKLSVKKAGSQ